MPRRGGGNDDAAVRLLNRNEGFGKAAPAVLHILPQRMDLPGVPGTGGRALFGANGRRAAAHRGGGHRHP